MRNLKTMLLPALLLLSPLTWAHTVNVTVTLKWIEPLQTENKQGDELYISVLSEDVKQHKDSLQRIPEAPLHWLSRYAQKLQNVKLWQGSILEGDEKKISLQLTEANNPPFEPDEDLGSIDLSLQNKAGELYLAVLKPTHTAHHLVMHYDQVDETLSLAKSNYRIMLSIENLSIEPNVIRRSR